MQKQEALEKIKTLVNRFAEQIEIYKGPNYNETQTRRDFIDPFFKALGWDIDNEKGYAEAYREVILEDKIKVDGVTKAPDYSFRIGGKKLFFVEAKRPSVDIWGDVGPAYQVRRYGWNAVAISILTDFEEFSVYDCFVKPKPNDNASVARIKYINFKDYEANFDFIWNTFSREQVLKGGLDKYITSDKNKQGTSTVDKEFLQSLNKWRVKLARNIALRNKNITEDILNFVVQHTIDRILFLRIAEDRNIEPHENLKKALQGTNYYENLFYNSFYPADQKYNSGLFDFKKDKISQNIIIDNQLIKEIIEDFYYPKCPYEFSVLSVEILGSAYEQFLGQQISLTSGGRARIEEKPEVKKAGGVYYTPQYIVDYIVENTLGKLLEKKTPQEIEKIKIVDPACGSGSFLIGAYQYLLDWHKDFYTQKGKQNKGKKDDVLTPMGELTTAEKKRILLNNIFGVDLDSNAVEVTKLSLLLKCMEGETKESIDAQQLFHERILPTLDNNIKSGNSLIDLDFYDNELDFGEEKKIKPFNWQNNFPEVFKNGGFDCVIGNPPYGAELSQEIQTYCLKKYNIGSTDTAQLFMIQAKNILRKNGFNGFIIPKAFTYASNWAKTREKMLDDISIVVDCSRVWKEVKLEMTIYISENENKSKEFISCLRQNTKIIEIGNIDKKLCRDFNFILNGVNNDEIKIAKKMLSSTKKINDFFTNRRGGMFQKELKTEGLYKVLGGKQIQRFYFNKNINFVNKKDVEAHPNAFISLESLLVQNIVAHIQNPFPRIKITATIANKEICENYLILDTVNQLVNNSNFSSQCLLGILNSKLTSWYTYRFVFANAIRTMHFDSPTTSKIPFPKIDLSNKLDKEKHDEIVKNVDIILELYKKLQTEVLPNNINQLKERIQYTENKIDQLVYELYNLTPEEIELVEKS